MSTLYTFALGTDFAIVEDAERARAKLEAGWTWIEMNAVMEAWAARDDAAFDRLWDDIMRRPAWGQAAQAGEPAARSGPVVAMAFGAKRKVMP